MGVLLPAAGPQRLQTIVSNLQDEAAVHHTVGGLQVAMGDDDAVVEEEHALVTAIKVLETAHLSQLLIY